jgi:hypothetical protein
MNAKDLKLLEKVFSAEVNSAINGGLYVAQIKSKRMEQLEKEGYVQKVTETLGGRFPVKVTGWALTELGRLTYCTSC